MGQRFHTALGGVQTLELWVLVEVLAKPSREVHVAGLEDKVGTFDTGAPATEM